METAPILNLIQQMDGMGVFVDPLLNNTIWRTTQPELQAQISTIVENLCLQYVGMDKVFAGFADLPYSVTMMRFCLHDVVVATGCKIAHEQLGVVYPSMTDIEQAGQRVRQFIKELGISVLYRLYLLVVGHDILQPFALRKSMTEEEFLYGICHHPYTEEQLDLFLMFGQARKTLRIKLIDGVRVVQLTKLGRELYEWTVSILEATKYIDKRIAMSYVYQFDVVQDWDDMCRQVWPDANEVRQKFVTWADLPSNTQILEVACGTGALTFDAGLYRVLGPSGRLIAIDVSSGMLDQAKRKRPQFEIDGALEFELASVEHLPFADAQFAACVGSAFLHFTDAAKAVAEMSRVVVPGGTVAILQGLDFRLDKPFFQDWFEPVYKLARQGQRTEQKTYLPSPDDLSKWFANAAIVEVESSLTAASWIFDCPEVVVQHIVRGISFFQRELMHLAWSDRKSMIRELIDRGHDVCQRYSLAERTIHIPSVMLKGRRAV